MERQTFRPYHPETGSATGLVPAILLIGLGAFFLLNNLHFVYFRDVVRFWPVILIAAGMVKLVDSTYDNSRIWGGVMVVAGGLLLARNMGYLDFGIGEMWPLLLIGVGLLMLYQRLSGGGVPRSQNVSGATLEDRINEHAVFGGTKRTVGSRNFQGGSADAVFGGVELDLRGADMQETYATIEADAVFGGVEIRIPREWSAVVQGSGVFGGFMDSTKQPDPIQVPNPKRLIVKGSAVFGGVEIKN